MSYDSLILHPANTSLAEGLLALGLSIDELVEYVQTRNSQKATELGVVNKVPISEVFDAFINGLGKRQVTGHKELGPLSLKVYDQVMNRFRSYCMKKTDGFVDGANLAILAEEFITNSLSSLKSSTQIKYIAVLRRFLQFYQFYYLPGKLVLPSFPGKDRLLPRSLHDAQVKELFDLARRSSHAIRLQFMLTLLLSTGLRRNEFRLAQLKDLTIWEEETGPNKVKVKLASIKVQHAKNGHPRVVPIPSEVIPVIETYCSIYDVTRPTDYLYGQIDMPWEEISNSALDQQFHRLAVKMKDYKADDPIYGFTIHSLRHTYATFLLRKKVPLRNIADLLGHSSLLSTQIYTVLDTERLREDAKPGIDYIGQLLTGGDKNAKEKSIQ